MNADVVEGLKKRKVAHVKCKKSFLFHTRYFFVKNHKKKYVIGDHHIQICRAMERVLKGEIKKLIINISPRYGKTELAVKNFITHGLSINPSAKFIHLSGSQELALDNSEEARDILMSDEYQKLFPGVNVKSGSTAKKKWFTTSGGGVYAASAGGQVTGFGAGLVDEEDEDETLDEWQTQIEQKEGFGGAIIIDDPIKPEDADNALARDKVNQRFDSTIVNRTNSRNTPIIIIMQRLHPNDLCGHVIKQGGWEVLSIPCLYEEEGKTKSLWPHKHTVEELYELRKNNVLVFERQYMQNPKPLEGLLYTTFNTYDDIKFEGVIRQSYTDVADTGDDYLFNVIYDEYKGLKYLIDVYYTQEPNETTEPELSNRLTRFGVNNSKIESNAGGRAFSRNVERLCREQGNYKTTFHPFHQSKNKVSRIINNSSTVQNVCMYPRDWPYRWPKFYDSMTTFMAKNCQDEEGKDDAQDGMTGMVETDNTKLTVRIVRR